MPAGIGYSKTIQPNEKTGSGTPKTGMADAMTQAIKRRMQKGGASSEKSGMDLDPLKVTEFIKSFSGSLGG